MDAKKVLTIIEIVAVVALVVGGYWYWKNVYDKAPEKVEESFISEEATQSLESIDQPIKKDALPQTNLFKETETNPFIDTYRNPFD